MRIPKALREAAALAVSELDVAPSATVLAANALRIASGGDGGLWRHLELHYEEYPQFRPTLADLAMCSRPSCDGSPLAQRPDLLRRAVRRGDRAAASSCRARGRGAVGRGARVSARAASACRDGAQGRRVNRLVLLDNEAVQALRDPAASKASARARQGHRFVFKRAVRTQSSPRRGACRRPGRGGLGPNGSRPGRSSTGSRSTDIPLGYRQRQRRCGHREADRGLGGRRAPRRRDPGRGERIMSLVLTSDPGDMRKVAEGRQVDVVTL